MCPLELVTAAEAQRRIADTPLTVELRELAIDPGATIVRSGGGLLLAHPSGRLAGAVGEVRSQDVDALYKLRDLDCELVADVEAHEALRGSRPFVRAVIHTLSHPWQPRLHEIAGLSLRLLAADDSLDHLDGELRAEIDTQLAAGSVLAGFMDGRAVSFTYATFSERHADVSIDTVPDYERRGIGTAVAAAMIDQIVSGGQRPVWGALVDNLASLRVAEKLGFDHLEGEVFLWEPQSSDLESNGEKEEV